MNPEAQRIAIAEACGWQSELWPNGFNRSWIHPKGYYSQCPDYLTDLNAMHEAEKVLRGHQAGDYDMHLWIVLKRDWEKANNPIATIASWHATAAQRAEAFLRTLGKWEDSK